MTARPAEDAPDERGDALLAARVLLGWAWTPGPEVDAGAMARAAVLAHRPALADRDPEYLAGYFDALTDRALAAPEIEA